MDTDMQIAVKPRGAERFLDSASLFLSGIMDSPVEEFSWSICKVGPSSTTVVNMHMTNPNFLRALDARGYIDLYKTELLPVSLTRLPAENIHFGFERLRQELQGKDIYPGLHPMLGWYLVVFRNNREPIRTI